jgi:hypothetical protein
MIPTITVDQMREVGRLMVEDVRIELIQMMENAGRCLARHGRSELGGDVRRRRVAVLAGRGGNGRGGLTAARRLAIWGGEALKCRHFNASSGRERFNCRLTVKPLPVVDGRSLNRAPGRVESARPRRSYTGVRPARPPTGSIAAP